MIDSGRCIVDAKWLFDRGDLHDAKIVKQAQTATELVIFVDDEWSNFTGLEEYPGAQSVALIVSGAVNFPDFSIIARELLLEVELLRTSAGVSLRFHTLGHPPLEAVGDEVFWNSCSPIEDKI